MLVLGASTQNLKMLSTFMVYQKCLEHKRKKLNRSYHVFLEIRNVLVGEIELNYVLLIKRKVQVTTYW